MSNTSLLLADKLTDVKTNISPVAVIINYTDRTVISDERLGLSSGQIY